MRNDVKEEVLNMKGVLNTDSNATKTEIAKLSANMAKEIEEMKTIITQVSTEGTVNFANMVAQHQQGHQALQSNQENMYTDLFGRMKFQVEAWEQRVQRMEASGGAAGFTHAGGNFGGTGDGGGKGKYGGYIPSSKPARRPSTMSWTSGEAGKGTSSATSTRRPRASRRG